MRLIDADELKKKSSKMMFEKATGFGSFDAVGVLDIDAAPTIDPESLRPTAEWIEARMKVQTEAGKLALAVHGNPDGQHHSTNIAPTVAKGW